MWLVAPVLDSVSLANEEATEIFLNNRFFKWGGMENMKKWNCLLLNG